MRCDVKNYFGTENKDCDGDVEQLGYHDENADDAALDYVPVEDDLYSFAVETEMVSVAVGIL